MVNILHLFIFHLYSFTFIKKMNGSKIIKIWIYSAYGTAQDDATLQKAITGFRQCAMLAAEYKLYDVFDYIIMSLSKMTGLLGTKYSNETANNPAVEVQNIEITVSDLAIQFGRN